MRIFDENNIEIENPDLELGHLKPDRIFIQHHEAIEAVEEVFHYEYTIYPNRGKDRRKVVDVEAVEAAEAWDEYEDVLRYTLYTEEELVEIEKQRNIPTSEERIAALEAALLELMGVTVDG